MLRAESALFPVPPAVISLVLLVSLSVTGLSQAPTEIRGSVISVESREIEIETESEWLPLVGDPVDVGFSLPNGQFVSAGKYQVSRVEDERVWAQPVGEPSGEVGRGYVATIRSDAPRRRTSESTALADANTSEVVYTEDGKGEAPFSDQTPPVITNGIPITGAEVAALRFFESGRASLVPSEQEHRNVFDRTSTRYVNWDLVVRHPRLATDATYTIVAVWMDPNLNILTTQSWPVVAEAGTTVSEHYLGFGWEEPGNWPPGEYRVYLSGDGFDPIADGRFIIR